MVVSLVVALVRSEVLQVTMLSEFLIFSSNLPGAQKTVINFFSRQTTWDVGSQEIPGKALH